MTKILCRMIAVMIAVLFSACLAVQPGLCVDDKAELGEPEIELSLEPASSWNSQLTFGILPAADLHGAAGAATISDYRLRLVRNRKLGNSLTLTVGGGYGLKHIDAPAAAELPSELHALFLEAGVHYRISAKSFVSLKLYPGLHGDFKEIGGDDVRVPLLVFGGYTFDSGVSLVGGFVYRFGYQSAALIPAIGLSYQPSEHWRLDLVAPRPALSYIASPQLRWYIAGDFTSEEYQLHQPSLLANVIAYRDYRAMFGVDYQPSPQVRLGGMLGYSFDRRFDFYDGTRAQIQMDEVPFLRLSLEYDWK